MSISELLCEVEKLNWAGIDSTYKLDSNEKYFRFLLILRILR